MKNISTELQGRYLWFNRGGRRFAASMEHLQEVLPLTGLRPLPASEPSLAGFMVLRDSVLPVFDPVSLISSTTRPLKSEANVIVLSLQGRPIFAVIAEEVGKVVRLPASPRLSSPVRIPAAFAGEIQPPGEERLFLLNVPELAGTMGLLGSIQPASALAA